MKRMSQQRPTDKRRVNTATITAGIINAPIIFVSAPGSGVHFFKGSELRGPIFVSGSNRRLPDSRLSGVLS